MAVGDTFTPNDKAAVANQIQGLFNIAAVLTKQPIMILSEKEAQAEANALCAVMDYHKFSFNGAVGPFGLYATLLATTGAILIPRINAIKGTRNGPQVEHPAQPATPDEVSIHAGKMQYQ